MPETTDQSAAAAQAIRTLLRQYHPVVGAARCPLPRDDWRDDDDNQFVVSFWGQTYLVTVQRYDDDDAEESITASSGNVFADLGLPDAEALASQADTQFAEEQQ